VAHNPADMDRASTERFRSRWSREGTQLVAKCCGSITSDKLEAASQCQRRRSHPRPRPPGCAGGSARRSGYDNGHHFVFSTARQDSPPAISLSVSPARRNRKSAVCNRRQSCAACEHAGLRVAWTFRATEAKSIVQPRKQASGAVFLSPVLFLFNVQQAGRIAAFRSSPDASPRSRTPSVPLCLETYSGGAVFHTLQVAVIAIEQRRAFLLARPRYYELHETLLTTPYEFRKVRPERSQEFDTFVARPATWQSRSRAQFLLPREKVKKEF